MADAIRFVSAGVGGGTGLYYVHSDHLGTPQKMTMAVRPLSGMRCTTNPVTNPRAVHLLHRR